MRGESAAVGASKPWALALVPVSFLLCLAIGGCGLGADDQSEEGGRTGATAYWTGNSTAFCKARIAVEAGQERAAARLLLQRRQVRPRGTLPVRIENLGRESLSYGVGPIAEQFVKGTWEPRSVVEPGEENVVPAIAVMVEGGSAGACNQVSIPSNWEPGRYRVTFELQLSDPDGNDVVLRPWGYFQVLPRASAQ